MIARKEYFVHGSTVLKDVDARVIGPVLQELVEQGAITADGLVEAAKSTNSPLHSYFDWDDARAAKKYRLNTAHDIIRSVRVKVTTQAGVARGLASQRVLVKTVQMPQRTFSHVTAPVRAVPKAFHEDNEIDAEIAALERKSLDRKYHPKNLDEAVMIIEVLRDQLLAITEDSSLEGREYGLTGKESRIYQTLKSRNGRPVTKEGLHVALYGNGSDVEIKIVDVFVCKIRKKLPVTESIETIWGVGYKWQQVTPKAA